MASEPTPEALSQDANVTSTAAQDSQAVPAQTQAPVAATSDVGATSQPTPAQNGASSSPALGNLLRLRPLALNDLPAHPAFAGKSGNAASEPGSRPELVPFIRAALTEAAAFIDTTVPKTFTKTGEKESKPSTAKVQQLKRMITAQELARVPWSTSSISRKVTSDGKGEAWFARKSLHANKRELGTAEFSEFDGGLRLNHSENERQYTPDVFDSYKVLDWDSETTGLTFDHGFQDVAMNLYEMCHKIPFPLSPRVFSVLVITATTSAKEFLVVQIPVDIHTLPEAFYSNGRNIREGDSSLKKKKVVIGAYTSVERCRVVEDSVEWSTATASDAKGWLPMWAQKMGVPGAILKDVGLVMKWTAERRS